MSIRTGCGLCTSPQKPRKKERILTLSSSASFLILPNVTELLYFLVQFVDRNQKMKTVFFYIDVIYKNLKNAYTLPPYSSMQYTVQHVSQLLTLDGKTTS